MIQTKTIAVLGAGWLGEPLAQQLQADGYAVKVATTREEKADRLRSAHLPAYCFEIVPDGINGNQVDFFEADILLLTLPPGGRRDPAVVINYPAKIKQAIAAAKSGGIQGVLFTSSTGIYGDQQGLVDEHSPLQPVTASAKALQLVEQELHAAFGDKLTILRLAGLAGGDRQPGRWFAGKTNVPGGEQYVNLVHRTDVMAICQEVIKANHWGLTLNVCANKHPTKADFYPQAATKLGLPAPSFQINNKGNKGKMIDNSRSKQLLRYQYQYPNPFDFPPPAQNP